MAKLGLGDVSVLHARYGILNKSCRRQKRPCRMRAPTVCRRRYVQYTSGSDRCAGLSDIVASAAAVVGSTGRVASVVATTAGTSLAVTSAVVFLFDDDRIAVTVVSVNQKGKKLERCQ